MSQKLTPRVEKIPLLVPPDWGHSVSFFRRCSLNSYFSLHLCLGFPYGLFYTGFVTTLFNFRLRSSFIRTLVIIYFLFYVLSLHRALWYSHSLFTNRCTFIKTLITIYIKIRWFLHVSVYDHLQEACNWAWLKLYWN